MESNNRPTNFIEKLKDGAESDDEMESDATKAFDDIAALDNSKNLFEELYRIPGVDDEINIKNIITNPRAFKKILSNLPKHTDEVKVSLSLISVERAYQLSSWDPREVYAQSCNHQ